MKSRKDSTGGGKRPWSAVDTLILILAAAAIASFVGRVIYAYRHRQSDEKTKNGTYSVQFTIENIHTESLGCIYAFDSVYLFDSGNLIGNIAMYESEDGVQQTALVAIASDSSADTAAMDVSETAETTDASDGMEHTSSSAHTAAEGRLICSGSELKDGCLLLSDANIYITAGTELKVCTERVVFTLRVSDISLNP